MNDKKDKVGAQGAENLSGQEQKERVNHQPGTPQPRHDDKLSPEALAKGHEEARRNMEQAQELEKQRPIHTNKSHQSGS